MVLVRHTRGTAARKNEAVSKKTIMRLMISVSGVMFLFGLTWLFAILTFSVTGLREAFQILFVLSNSFQGFFIFLFFCVFNNEAIESWKELLSCGKYQSKLLHPSQAKFSSSAVTKKAKQTKTGSTGFSSTSGGKYVSEASKSDYESATLAKGNVYENTSVESKVDLGTDPTTHTFKGTDQVLTQTADIAGAVAPVVIVDQTDSTDGVHYKNGSATALEKVGKKQKKGKSLKARIKRYSTKKTSKHHVEEIEVDFDSDSSSHGSSDEEDATTQL